MAAQRRLDPERAHQPQHGVAYGGIDAQPAKRDAGPGAVIEMRAAAAIADAVAPWCRCNGTCTRRPQCPQRSSPASSASPRRTAPRAIEAPAVGVIGDQPLVPLELFPGNVALVMIGGSIRPSPRGRGGGHA